MDEISEKKKRAPNYSNREKSLLLETVSGFKDIVENKKTDAVTWKNKDEGWDSIAKIFNSRSTENIYRAKESLRKYYENVKKNVRKQVVEEKKEIYRTGGGVVPKSSYDECTKLVLGIINSKTVYGLSNSYDGDSQSLNEPVLLENSTTNFEEVDSNANDEHNYCIELENEGPSPAIVHKNEHKKINTAQLRQPKDTALVHKWTSRRRPAIQQQHSSKLAEEYSELAKLKTSLYKEEQTNIRNKEERNKEMHELQKRKLLLEMEKTELEIKKIKKYE